MSEVLARLYPPTRQHPARIVDVALIGPNATGRTCGKCFATTYGLSDRCGRCGASMVAAR